MVGSGLYKVRLTSVADVIKRSQNLLAERNEKRREFLWGSRLQPEQPSPVEKKKPSRAEMLKKWKEEKLKKLEEEKKKEKPIFKVGIVQRKATGSPILTQAKIKVQQTTKKPQLQDIEVQRTRVLTRARAKNLNVKVAAVKPVAKPLEKGLNNKFYKIEGGTKKKIDSHVFIVPESVSKLPPTGLTIPSAPTCSKSKIKNKKVKAKMAEKKTVQPNVTDSKTQAKEQKATAKTPNVKSPNESVHEKSICSEVDSEYQVVSPPRKEVDHDGYVPIVFIPFVTVRNGKKSPRKSKKSLTMDVEEQIKKEESEFKCRIFSFRKYIECEKKRLLSLCDKWKRIYEEFPEIPSDVEGDIDSLIGKTNLLTSDKFMQFQNLIDKCENGDPLIKVDDLQGFQDWVSIEVERIDVEFHKLEKRKNNDWKSETISLKVSKAKKINVPKISKKPAASSNIRSHILAARKLLKEANPDGNQESQLSTRALELEVKTTPKKENFLKDVLNSETKKKSSAKKSPIVKERRNSGLEIMIATQKNKFPTPVKLQKSLLLTNYEIFVGEEETPSKSILKKTPKTTSSSKTRVTFKKVTENLVCGGRLSERYFQPLMDEEDDFTPVRTVLGDLGNLTPDGIQTRSQTKHMSYSLSSSLVIPQNN